MKFHRVLYAACFVTILSFGGDFQLQNSYHTDHRTTVKLQFNPAFENTNHFSGQELAVVFLEENAGVYGLPADLSNIQLKFQKESLAGNHFHFQQYLHGIEVEGGEIVVSVLLKNPRVYQVYNNTYPEPKNKRPSEITLSEDDAYDIAWMDLAVHGDIMSQPKIELVYTPEGKDFRLNYLTYLGVEAPFGHFIHRIDAETGKILEVKDGAISRLPRALDYKGYEGPIDNRNFAFKFFAQNQARKDQKSDKALMADGTGKVFDPDPRTTLQNPDLQDGSPASAFTAAYFTRSLLGIQNNAGTWSLTGPWIYISNFEAPNTAPSTTPDGNWTAERGNNAFNDAVVYFHIDQNQRYMQSLGFTGTKGIQELSIEADSDGVNGDDNSHYIPSTNQLAWGHGCVDDSEDMFVVLHEYGHAIQHSIQPSNWSGGDTGAMGEGFGDYWGGSYKYASPNGPTFHPEWAFAWDGHGTGNQCWPGRIMNAFAAQYVHTTFYGAHSSIGGGLQSDELWSTPLFQSLVEIIAQGGTREQVDQIVLESHFGIGAGLKMRDMANATIATANILQPGGVHAQIFIDKFLVHNIVTIPAPSLAFGTSTFSNAGINGVPDPGETVGMKIHVTNQGTLGAVNITGTLSTTTPSVNIIQNVSAYPDLAIGAGADNETDFEIQIDPTFTCGDPIDLTLTIQYDNSTRATKIMNFQIGTGIAQGADASVSPGTAIPDNTTITSDIVVSGTGMNVTASINFDVNISHTYIGDLEVSVESPNGTIVILHDNTGAGADDIIGNYPGDLTPAGSLSGFLGEPLDGTWTLSITDSAGGDTGTLNSWAIHDISGYECETASCATSSLAVDAGDDFVACASAPTQLLAQGSGGQPGYLYLWDHASLLDNPQAANPTANVTETTTFEVTITDDQDCTQTDTVTLYVYENYLPFVENWNQSTGPELDMNGDAFTNVIDILMWANQCH